jgi:hypothetical protein
MTGLEIVLYIPPNSGAPETILRAAFLSIQFGNLPNPTV